MGGYTDTYPCPDPTFRPAPGQSVEDFLITDAKLYVDTILPTYVGQVYHELAIDDVTVVENGLEQRVTSKLFTLTGDLSLIKPNQVLDSCITGKPQKAVSDGYWAMIVGLTPGKHKLKFLQNDAVTGTIDLNIVHD